MSTTVKSDEWVHWFDPNGKVQSYHVESTAGQQVLARLELLGWEPPSGRRQRRRVKPRASTCLECGRKMEGRKSKVYCNARCRAKHSRLAA